MNCYEHTFILRQDLSEVQSRKIIEKYQNIITKNSGKVLKTEEWGLRNLTYEIKKNKKKTRGSRYTKLSLFQKPDVKFFRPCHLSGKDAPVIDYKNIKLLRKYISESGKILPSRVTSVSLKKQKELTNSIKRARLLALI